MADFSSNQAHLEREYLPWSDAQAILANWTQKSATYLARANLERNVSYGASEMEQLDILGSSSSASDSPILVFIHGGYWQWLDKDHYAFALEPVVNAGALVVNINYPLCPTVGLDTLIATVRAACAWVWRHARQYGGNPSRLYVAGHSAGGHLAAMMAVTDWTRLQEGLPRDMIKGVLPISGIFDLAPILSTTLNSGVRMDRESARRNSPIHLVPATTLVVTAAVGDKETNELLRQSRDFANTWRGKVRQMVHIESLGHDHFAVIEALTEPGNALMAAILRHLARRA